MYTKDREFSFSIGMACEFQDADPDDESDVLQVMRRKGTSPNIHIEFGVYTADEVAQALKLYDELPPRGN